MEVSLILSKPGSCLFDEVLAPSLCPLRAALGANPGWVWGMWQPREQQPGRKWCGRGISECVSVCVCVCVCVGGVADHLLL